MRDRMMMLIGVIAAAALMVAALWGWQNATWLVSETARPDVAGWAVKCGAVCAAAGAQVVVMTFVVSAIYRRDVVGEGIKLAAALVFTVALVGAIALGVASR